MNLAEYRRDLRGAFREYQEAVQHASDNLQKRLEVAQSEFLGENEKAVPPEEDVPARYHDRDKYNY